MNLAGADLYSIQAGVHEITSSPYKLKADDTDKEITRMLDRLMKNIAIKKRKLLEKLVRRISCLLLSLSK